MEEKYTFKISKRGSGKLESFAEYLDNLADERMQLFARDICEELERRYNAILTEKKALEDKIILANGNPFADTMINYYQGAIQNLLGTIDYITKYIHKEA